MTCLSTFCRGLRPIDRGDPANPINSHFTTPQRDHGHGGEVVGLLDLLAVLLEELQKGLVSDIEYMAHR